MALSMPEKPIQVEVESALNELINGYTTSTPNTTPYYDMHGLPLVPQPSADPMDPLNWKPWIKILVLVQVSILSFVALLSASLIVCPPPGSSVPYSLFPARVLSTSPN
jgi:hypothetical protein